jgi:(1->4)-alpha-D-glucan 1-alpha-D-glucosylmutase
MVDGRNPVPSAQCARPVPRATYRLQFSKEFDFGHAAELASYLADLGVSHVYASPYLKARPGSTHGYDIVDHRRLNPELGDEASFRAMSEAFRFHELGQILDFVPNHMGVGGADNAWWQDVLEWGPDSECAGWFDIDWGADRMSPPAKILVPFLGDQYGTVLESGQLELRFHPDTGGFAVWAYATHKLPICPLHYERILDRTHPLLEQLGDAFSALPRWRSRLALRAKDLRAELSTLIRDRSDARQALDDAVARFNGVRGQPKTWRRLDALIGDQHWRAAHFRVAADDINYRRFFNINELAGLRMEVPELFEHAHGLVFELLADGTLEGLRIDHVDGLLDPKAYLHRLRDEAPRPFYLVVEKILARHENLPEDWPVEGTTGYEFTNLLLGLLIDPAGESAFTDFYAGFTGEWGAFADIVRECKIRIIVNEMAGELNVLARDAARIARQNPHTVDFTHNILWRALKEIIACFPVYRTYVDTAGRPSETDRRYIDWAVARARREEPDVDITVFDFLHTLLTADRVSGPDSGFSRLAVIDFAMRVQQYSGPVMAKGLEDTGFYRYNRFIALNEVGGAPDQFGVPLASFHNANARRAKTQPHTMLATSTHDTKRGEDARARLAVLSEIPDEWQRHLRMWSRVIRARLGDVSGEAAPDRNDEYFFFQLLLSVWPPALNDSDRPDENEIATLTARLETVLIKSVRESKRHSTWVTPNRDYEDAFVNFLHTALDVSRPNAFLETFLPFQSRIARFGACNSLVQVTLKLTLPGMPDLYQGTELWDLNMVDPDNRRAVDYAVRRRLLDEIKQAIRDDRQIAMREMMRRWTDGRCKMAVIATLLSHRRDHPTLYANGCYEPVTASGAKADQICAFARSHEGDAILVVASRFPARLASDPDWANTDIAWPTLDYPVWLDLLTGRTFSRAGRCPSIATILEILPVAVLTPKQKADRG